MLIFSACAAPRSAILFIGDGMGMAQVTAARIYEGNAAGGELALDTIPNVGLVRTYATNNLVTDSAASATAMATGHKTDILRISTSPDGEILETILEKAKKAGLSVGVVSTTSLTHATPACFYAHVPSRMAETEIAAQLVDGAVVDVAMGGGRMFFLPKGVKDEESGKNGTRKDGRNLIVELQEAGYRVVQSQEEFDQLGDDLEQDGDLGKVVGLFEYSHMNYDAERGDDVWGEPSLEEMTRAAIKILERNPKGYFLMVEGGRIDHACHVNMAQLAVTDLLAFDRAVAVGLEKSNQPCGPLVVVTADHETGGLAINGYPGIDYEGEAFITATNSLATGDILTFATGPGAKRPKGEPDRTDLHYQQPALGQARRAAHTGVDVAIWAAGPGAEAFGGTMLNSDIATKMMDYLGLE